MRLAQLIVMVALLGVTACDTPVALPKASSMKDLVFLTRDGCVNTPLMRGRLDEALKSLALSSDYTVIDSDALPKTDPRGGYPTPTVLYQNRDLFGMPEPSGAQDPAT